MKNKKPWIVAAVILILFLSLGIYARYLFLYDGLDHALVGQTAEDRYPDWEKWNDSESVSRLDYDIQSKHNLCFSKVYLLERANHYQVRFRIGYVVPFLHSELFGAATWVLEDSAGNSYTKNMVVSTEQIAGLNCINVTLILNEEEFSFLSGKELKVAAVCSKEEYDKTDLDNSYASCEVKILLP